MRIVIGGLGKSGTTALFYAIRAAMPPDTLCLFEPSEFRPVSAIHVLAKILAQQGVDWSTFREFEKQIFIVRDPRDQLLSFLLYSVYDHPRPFSANDQARLLALVERKERQPRSVPLWHISEEIERIMGTDHRAILSERHNLARNYLREFPRYHRLAYEDFVAGRTQNLSNFLGFSLPTNIQVDEGLRRVERTRGAGDWRNWFVPEDVQYFRPVLSGLMQAYDYADQWELPSHPAIEPRHGTLYLRRLFKEQDERLAPRPPAPAKAPRRGLRGITRKILKFFRPSRQAS